MPDPVTLTAVAFAGLPVVATFLLDRVGYVLDRGRGRAEEELPVVQEPSEQGRAELEELRERLAEAAGRTDEDLRADAETLAAMERARRLLEEVHGRQIDFTGENRPATRHHIRSVVELETGDAGSDAAGVRIRRVRKAVAIESRVTAGEVKGRLTGVEIDDLD
ncbi:hypothetical protein [Thermomonospora umbrina]|uniref:Uncharacterized protein n=1 Tax=Thermomonospora umbrina TaxID=111806 RepID=A0A3D9SY23_9ACTN|nr:hypothetical protein [Thermomonospora umbrina]REE96511.1 hypothetical protein DFJ69_1948 [Thermomonospora umbrina]